MDITVNCWAVLIASVVSMVIGSIWYGPLFGKMYMKCVGMDTWSEEKKAEMKKSMIMSYVGQFIASFVTFYVLAWLVGALNQMSVMGGVQTALWAWIGFIVPMKYGDSLWGGKMTLFWLGVGSSLLIFVAGGAVIGAM